MSRSLCIVLLLGVLCLEHLQARFVPDGERHRYVRRRISPDDPDLVITEVKEVSYVRRPKKVVIPLDEDEIDWRIRCDFEPNLPECGDLVKKPVTPSLPKRSPTTRATQAPTTRATQAPTTTRSTTRRTTTTPEPLRDEAMERKTRCYFDPTLEECAPPTTTSTSTSTTTTTTELPKIPELNEAELEPVYEHETVDEEENVAEKAETEPEEEVETGTEPENDIETEPEEEVETETEPENDIETNTGPDVEKEPETIGDTQPQLVEEATEAPSSGENFVLSNDDESDDEDDEDQEDEDQEEEDLEDEAAMEKEREGGSPYIGQHDAGDWN